MARFRYLNRVEGFSSKGIKVMDAECIICKTASGFMLKIVLYFRVSSSSVLKFWCKIN